MKKLILLSCLLILFLPGISQQESTAAGIPQNNYLANVKKQNTAGWLFLSGGLTVTLVGIIVGESKLDSDFSNILDPEVSNSMISGATLMIIGAGAMIASIPFFIASSGIRKEAASAFFKMETRPVLIYSSSVKTSYPAVGVKIRL